MEKFQVKCNERIIDEYIDVQKDREDLYKLMKEVYVTRKVIELQLMEKEKLYTGSFLPNHSLIEKHETVCKNIQKKLERIAKRDQFTELEHGIIQKLMKQWNGSRNALQDNNFRVQIGWTVAFEDRIKEYYRNYFDRFGGF